MILKAVTAAATLLCVLTSPAHAAWYSEQREIMGTQTGVTLEVADKADGPALAAQVFAEFDRFDQAFSSYKPDSQLSLVNQNAAQTPQKISDEFIFLIQQSLRFHKITNGLFDISYAAIGQNYDYRAAQKPTEDAIDQALPLVNANGLILDTQAKTLAFQRPGMRIDLGGIGKGYVVDRAIELLQAKGVTNASVFAGGDSRFYGAHGDRPWVMGIRHPRSAEEFAVKMPIENAAVSTSGDYERFFIDAAGQRHHHILHPKTGHSPGEIISATVIGNDNLTTDAMSTSVLIAGVTQGLALIAAMPGLEAVIIDYKGKMHYSEGLAPPESGAE